mmetsp:Transcript_41066/g.96564  ORF Transcript_41066/g.96564 Transcript_41066/m.96564 type:complete len:131 (+) Transcript_41066:157-549(+)
MRWHLQKVCRQANKPNLHRMKRPKSTMPLTGVMLRRSSPGTDQNNQNGPLTSLSRVLRIRFATHHIQKQKKNRTKILMQRVRRTQDINTMITHNIIMKVGVKGSVLNKVPRTLRTQDSALSTMRTILGIG